MIFNIKKATGHGISLALLMASAWGEDCPFLKQQKEGANTAHILNPHRKLSVPLSERTGDQGVPEGGYEAVMEDLKALMTDSKDSWPADFEAPVGPSYAGLFIRLAWHCSGSYRNSDGRGGCDGGRIRFDPELDWEDNANLHRALELLEPIKETYGSSLSWGDLVVLAGNAAYESTGATLLGFCGGRIDDENGDASLNLGPGPEQEAIGPCQDLRPNLQGMCLSVDGTALGPTTVGLIYVNPAGPEGAEGDTAASAADIRQAFARMGQGDAETVSLIGGGHAIGKCHGACADPPCGAGTPTEGIGNNTFTSGFEGSWSTTPTTFSNQYFNNLFDYDWKQTTSPAGALQWAPFKEDGSAGPDIIMLTADLALTNDDKYRPIAENYAANQAALENDFAAAWYKLTSADMGPATRCLGSMVPEPQPFQRTLPHMPEKLPDYIPVRSKIQGIIDSDDAVADKFINLAFRCAFTFRATDYQGGCNGARIRFSPESDWPANQGTSEALGLLGPVKDTYPDVSYADLIVLAALTALEDENGDIGLTFCGGYVDAEDAEGSESLAPRFYDFSPLAGYVFNADVVSARDDFQVKGLSARQGVALAARENLSGRYFEDLTAACESGSDDFTNLEKALCQDEFGPIVEEFAKDEAALKENFVSGWTYMMTADRFKNNAEIYCDGVNTPTKDDTTKDDTTKDDTTKDDTTKEDTTKEDTTASTATAPPTASTATAPSIKGGMSVVAAALALVPYVM